MYCLYLNITMFRIPNEQDFSTSLKFELTKNYGCHGSKTIPSISKCTNNLKFTKQSN